MKKKQQPTELAKTVEGGDMRGDSDAKRLFQINEIAAWFLKSCVEEFRQLPIQEIVSGWIAKADRRLGTEPVMPDVPPRIPVIGSEDNSRTDGTVYFDFRTVYFDFRTEIPLPNAPPTAPLLVMDMELQNDYKKNLALHKRSVYYDSRLISSQPGRLMSGKIIYQRLCRTCGFWIFPNAPKRLANHVRHTRLVEENVVGTAPLADGEDEACKLIDIWKFYLHDGIPPSKEDTILWLLYVLLTRTMSCEEKFRILVNDFDFKLTEEVERMCTYTEMVQRESERKGEIRGIKKGKREGIEESHLKFYSNLKKAKFNDNAICAYMGITMQKLMELKKLLSENVNLEPKTV